MPDVGIGHVPEADPIMATIRLAGPRCGLPDRTLAAFCLSSILADHVFDESSDLSRHSALHR
jgi:hypothetical protein